MTNKTLRCLLLTFAIALGLIPVSAQAASVYDAGLYSQVPLTDVSDANRATYVADAKAAGVDAVWISVVDFFEEDTRRKPILDHLAAEIRHFESAGFAVGVWINGFGYGNERPYFKDSVKITTLEGKTKGGAVCPLDPKLRRALVDNVRDIARAGAKFILMDDDYVQSARSLIGCSCPRHLARVAAKCGRQVVTLEDVKAAFTGTPNAVRTAYLDVTGEVAMELAHELRQKVDEVNPAVGMGLCASYTHWDVEGCDLLGLVSAFAGKGRKVLRISGAPYWPNAKLPGTGLADIIEFVRMQSAWTRGLDMTVFDENDPYPRKVAQVPPWRCELYDKAIIADGCLARHKYMLCYGPDRAEPGYLEAHLADMPDDVALRRIFAGTEPYGVKVDCPQHRLRMATLPTPFAGEAQIAALYSQPTAAFDLRRKGIPTRFNGPAASDEPLVVTVRATSDVYQIVHCDREKGEYAVLLENMGKTAVDVNISVMGKVRVIETLRGSFSVVPGGLSLAQLSPHAYAAIRFARTGETRCPDGFVALAEAVPDAILEIRYYSTYNFVGDRIDGYERPCAMLTREAARALKAASDECVRRGYRLKVYDAYRPQRAVSHFMRWAKDVRDVRMKAFFYPDLDKSVLFAQGYIAEKSGHSRGSTVDLTLFDMKTGKEVDMGGTFDWFGIESHPDFKGVTEKQFANRMLLREIMVKHGFKPLVEEWWHFTLAAEPYPDTYFDFPVF